ncbi:MAG: LTA synthase family protein [Bacteroidetes bacterium]|nr:LTA synthase family protein [Bacteroidota bacterium]
MKRLLTVLAGMFLFWLLFFILARIVFIVYYFRLFTIEGVPGLEIFSLFYHGLQLDVSTACYLLVLPFFILVAQSRFPYKWLDKVQRVYNGVMVVVYSLICVGEIGIYAEWKSKLDYKALTYLRHPQEIATSTSLTNFLILLLLTVILSLLGIFLFNRLFYRDLCDKKRSWATTVIFFLLFPGFLFLGIRGGLQPIPINQAQSYFSRHNLVNQVAVNPGFNLLHSFLESQSYLEKNPFLFYPLEEARKTVNDLYQVRKDTTVSILSTQKPNIVLFILESWSADLVESLGGEPGITPEFRKLEKEGILFTRFYASGNRSQQGMASVFGGFPSLPITAISNHYAKFVKLPSLVKDMKSMGYKTSYYFGGQLIYGGLRAYILFNDFDRIMEEKDYPASIPRGRLGIHDQYTMDRLLEDLDNEKQPFFSTLFTLSTHSPYDEPMKPVLTWGGNENQYINSGYYTDKCLGDFIRKARQKPWYNNTLFIILADHSHNSYRNWWLNTPSYRKIPLLIFGNVVKEEFRGKQVSKISSQTDIAATLLTQLGRKGNNFSWSKNLFNPYTPDFAYYEIQIGCGWIRPDGNFAFQNEAQTFEHQTFPDPVKDQRIKEGKSYLEVLFQQFMDY